MMASKKGYRDLRNFSNDSEMITDYYGLIARGKSIYVSHWINVNEGKLITHKLTAKEAVQIRKDWDAYGWSEAFVERWIIGKVT